MQESEAQTISLDNFVTPINSRISKNLVASGLFTYKGWYAQVNCRGGLQDLASDVAVPVLPRYIFSSFDAQVGGDFDIAKGLILQPHIAYTFMGINDQMRHAFEWQQGYINGKHTLHTASGGFRLEYKPIQQLRFVAGLRHDQYWILNTGAFSYQLLASYMPNDNHLIRINYSRACRGLFVPSLYADITDAPMANSQLDRALLGFFSDWYAETQVDTTYYLSIKGNTKLKPPQFDMYELGYRWKITDQYQLELEGFYTTMRQFDAPVIDELVKDSIRPGTSGILYSNVDKRTYQNMDMVAHQFGGTLSFTAMPISSLTLRGHVTWQQTQLRNYTIMDGARSLNEFGKVKYLTKTVDMQHQWTPRVFAGLSASYFPLEDKSLAIYADAHLITRQLYRYPMLVKGVQAKLYDEIPLAVRGNISVSYRVIKPLTLFVAAHNIGRKYRQYGFGDAVGTSVIGGVRLTIN